MEIDFIYLPILICVLSWFIAWIFSGFCDTSEEVIFSSPISMLVSTISGISGLFCLVYYPIKLIIWIYNNVTINF